MGALNLLGFWVFYLRLPNRIENTLMKQLFFNSVATVLMALGLVGSTVGQSCALEAVATLQTQLWGGEVSYTISDDNGILAEGQGVADYAVLATTFCLDSVSGCLTLQMIDSFGDGWNGASLDVSIPALGISLGAFTLEEGNFQAISFGEGCEEVVVEVEGCTDPTAFNYDPYATVDDGSCSYDCECEDIYEPVCAYDYLTGNYVTFDNACEAACAQAYVISQGDCSDQPVYGCTNEEAINYNPDATDDDGSCVVVPECTEDQSQVVATLQTELWGSEVSFSISNDEGVLLTGQGWTDYDAVDTYFCLGDSAGCLTLEMFDSFGDGWNGATLDLNIPSLGLSLGTFTLDEGSYLAVTFGVDCDTEVVVVEGCTDPSAFNYDSTATVDDGSCSYDCGCEDVYEPVCGFDYFTGNYVTFNNACEAACAQAFLIAEGDCSDQPIYGCTDEDALNYNPDATDDDGSCIIVPECSDDEAQVLVSLQTDIWGNEVSFSISDANGVLVSGEGLGDYMVFDSYFCLGDSTGCLTLEMFDSFGDGWNGASIDINIPSLGLALGTFTLETGVYQAISFGIDCETEVLEVEGCTDHLAFNFNPYATVDDGSCSYDCECEEIYDPVCGYDYLTGTYITYNNLCEAECAQAWVFWEGDCADQPIYGCTDETAINYNPDATDDDGSCVQIPVCGDGESDVMIEINGLDTLVELGFFAPLYYTLTTGSGEYVELVYDYNQFEMATAYGCLADGCYNFFMYDYGWEPGTSSVDVTISGVTTTYTFEEGSFEAAYAIGVNTEGCEVTIPVYGCTDAEAMNYNPDANTDDGSCLYPCECDDVYDPVCAYDYFTGDYVTFNNACEAECWNAWVVWDGDCADQPIYGCTNPDALNYNPQATEDDGSCAVIPECGENQTELLIQTAGNDSLNDLGIFVSLYWNLTTDLGQYVELVYDYNEAGTTAYGCLDDGCYNFYLYDYGWIPGLGTADVSLNGEVTSYSVGADQFDAVFALGVNTEGCEVTIPGCTDPEALNYYASATVDDGSCQYPLLCDNGEIGYVYLSTSLSEVNLDIVSDAGDLVYSEQDAFNFGGVYGEICIEPNVCYTAVVTGDMIGGNGWNDGVFGVSTGYLDLVYAEWPADEDSWVIQFSLDGACGQDTTDGIYGCTDPEALNFDPAALLDDGSCEYETLCPGMFEVTFVLDGGAMPDDVNLNVSNEDGDILMEMDGYTGSSTGCVPAGCYRVEMMDALGDGWNGAFAEVFVDGESAGTMTLEEGEYEMQMVGLGMDCETPDNTDDIQEAVGTVVSIDLFPNPGQDMLNIRSSGLQSQAPVALVVFNAEGRLVHEVSRAAQGNLETWNVDASTWEAGFYIIQLNQGTSMAQQRWVKLN